MKPSISILHPGFYTTVQDNGREGYAHLGVPQSGAMDKHAFMIANAILNNIPHAAMLECTLLGPTIVFNHDVNFVITGSNAGATLDGAQVMEGVPVLAKAKQVLKMSKINGGSRSYLAFAGGLDSQTILGSKSWYYPLTPEGKLTVGMELPLGISKYGKSKGAHLKMQSQSGVIHSSVVTIKVYQGPEFSKLTYNQQQQLSDHVFTVSNLWNRMAIQLVEPLPNTLKGIYTSPVIPGTVQLTPSGKLIFLMNDCQTTGGYPRVLQVVASDLNKLAQMQQGSQFLLNVT
ncbi:biotin-dependent carboxyltransferase family protein [Dokdonia sp. 4H-3-7-5]|uniref:5-oxoprolinase subunit C family protein n=1 Tax=Dokdonia sp. (strain 4H-3-7-5) TaxID=983548 RepID=UPI00020A6269|nr:biotin-dependent carboxyltransferase family protein [Dokdonia sp. 4H-3-7-5]AEE18325.1 Allophanate hydrolase subunit 2 [Dokdonia sp. 4H-3-7-5]